MFTPYLYYAYTFIYYVHIFLYSFHTIYILCMNRYIYTHTQSNYLQS